jgi:hypothetical protein
VAAVVTDVVNSALADLTATSRAARMNLRVAGAILISTA